MLKSVILLSSFLYMCFDMVMLKGGWCVTMDWGGSGHWGSLAHSVDNLLDAITVIFMFFRLLFFLTKRTGLSAQCPSAVQKPNGTFCNDHSQICNSGVRNPVLTNSSVIVIYCRIPYFVYCQHASCFSRRHVVFVRM
jgi:hypothetical protein